MDKGIRVELLLEIVITLATKIATVVGVKLCLIVLMLYYFCGRAGELGLLTLTKIFMVDSSPFVALPNPKTLKEQHLDIYPHYNEPLLDVFYWWSAYMFVSPFEFSVGNEMAWLFPELRRKYGPLDREFRYSQSSTNIATTISSHLQRLLSDTLGFALQSHMFRRGSADDMFLHQRSRDTCRVVFGAFFRGGWSFGNECEFSHYFFQRFFITHAVLALARYPNTNMLVSLPTFEIIMDTYPDKKDGKEISNDCIEDCIADHKLYRHLKAAFRIVS